MATPSSGPEFGNIFYFSLLTENATKQVLKYYENKTEKASLYYKVRAWFTNCPDGTFLDALTIDKLMKSANECEFYVAEELIDVKFRDHPTYTTRHLLNYYNSKMEQEGGIMTLEDACIQDYVKEGYCLLKITEEFFYGQRSNGKDRFVVYHPKRDVYQGRFRKDNKAYYFESAVAAIPSITIPGLDIKVVSMDETKAKKLSSLLLCVFGDELHQFMPPEIQGKGSKPVLDKKLAQEKVKKV
ncbi:hypothetical protein BX600DRAFT_431764 [Xylariales sp. PMI_506]|nr:hypothetical protein BX600DRAFT_431764 [Xylariales sp. PMI_506]